MAERKGHLAGTIVGSFLLVYGLYHLSRIPAALSSSLFLSPPEPTIGGLFAPLARVLMLGGSRWVTWILMGVGWLISAAFVVGGICTILRRRSGMEVGLNALVGKLILSLIGLPVPIFAALGWITLEFSHPRWEIFRQSPPTVQRMIWWSGVAVIVVETMAFGALLLWLHRELRKMRE